MKSENVFIFDSVLPEKDICNYVELRKELIQEMKCGYKVVLYGLRNTGKTSLVKSSLLPTLKKEGYLIIYADFFGVHSLEQIEERLYLAIQESLLNNFPLKTRFAEFLKSLKTIRPILKTDPTDGVSLSLDFLHKTELNLTAIFKSISEINKKVPCILVFDEFQDIHYVKQADALLRTELQIIDSNIGVIFMGSKKHLLSKLFAKPKAPLAGIGRDKEMPFIDYQEYCNYIQMRFKRKKLNINLENATFLQDILLRIPEAINMVCDHIFRNYTGPLNIEQDIIINAVQKMTDLRRSRFEEYLSHYTPNEQKVLSAIAKIGPIMAPSSIEFVSYVKISQKGISNIIKKFEDEALIYKTKQGYIIPDALLSSFLRRYRM
jgi:predicted AAA+ superfamily ATPase